MKLMKNPVIIANSLWTRYKIFKNHVHIRSHLDEPPPSLSPNVIIECPRIRNLDSERMVYNSYIFINSNLLKRYIFWNYIWAYLHTKFQVSIIILTSFRQGVSPLQNLLKSPPRLGLNSLATHMFHHVLSHQFLCFILPIQIQKFRKTLKWTNIYVIKFYQVYVGPESPKKWWRWKFAFSFFFFFLLTIYPDHPSLWFWPYFPRNNIKNHFLGAFTGQGILVLFYNLKTKWLPVKIFLGDLYLTIIFCSCILRHIHYQ